MNTFEIEFNFIGKNGDVCLRIWSFKAKDAEHAKRKMLRSLNAQAKKTLSGVIVQQKNAHAEVREDRKKQW